MAAVLVAYGWSTAKARKWTSFCGALGALGRTRVVLDNALQADTNDRMAGSNFQFEFSGYREVLAALIHKVNLPENEPVVVVNDSVFSHHFGFGWAHFLRITARRAVTGVWGDPRIEPVTVDGRPLIHLASWIFLLPDAKSRIAFSRALAHVTTQFEVEPSWPGYAAFLDRYYAPNRRWGGYTQRLTPRDESRKKKCSWAEHRLSIFLQENQQFRPFSGLLYRTLHNVDRVLSAYKRLRDK